MNVSLEHEAGGTIYVEPAFDDGPGSDLVPERPGNCGKPISAISGMRAMAPRRMRNWSRSSSCMAIRVATKL